MGGTKVDGGNGTDRRNGKAEITISDEEIASTMQEIFGPSGGAEYRDAPLELLRLATNFTMFKSAALIVKVFEVELKRGNLTVIKLLFDLLAQFAKHGSIEPGEMQSFADVLMQSLEAEKGTWAAAAVEPGSDGGSGPGSEAVSEAGK